MTDHDLRIASVWALGGVGGALCASWVRTSSYLSHDAAIPWLGYLLSAGMITVGIWFFLRPRPLVAWEAFVSVASIVGFGYLVLSMAPLGTAILIGSFTVLVVLLSEWWLTHALFLMMGGIGIAMNVSRWSPDVSILAGIGLLLIGYAQWKSDHAPEEYLIDVMVARHVYPCIFIPSRWSQMWKKIPDLHAPVGIGLGSCVPLWTASSWIGWTSWQQGLVLVGIAVLTVWGIRSWKPTSRLQTVLVASAFLSFAGMRILSHVW